MELSSYYLNVEILPIVHALMSIAAEEGTFAGIPLQTIGRQLSELIIQSNSTWTSLEVIFRSLILPTSPTATAMGNPAHREEHQVLVRILEAQLLGVLILDLTRIHLSRATQTPDLILLILVLMPQAAQAQAR